MKPLGRRVPADWEHIDKYPLRAVGIVAAVPKPVPVALGISWYSNFDNPVKIGRDYWIGRGGLGSVRGGHAICARPHGASDLTSWWDFYDQGAEGACVGFSCSRMMTLLNRKRYEARWLWDRAKEIDEWPDTNPGDDEGTSVRAACDVLRTAGHVLSGKTAPWASEGIVANRWATNWDEVREVLGVPDDFDGVYLMNSWGRDFPHYVRLTDEAGEQVLAEDGEAALVTDR